MMRFFLPTFGTLVLILAAFLFLIRQDEPSIPPYIAYATRSDIWTIRTDGTQAPQHIFAGDVSWVQNLTWSSDFELLYTLRDTDGLRLKRFVAGHTSEVLQTDNAHLQGVFSDTQAALYDTDTSEIFSIELTSGNTHWQSNACHCAIELPRWSPSGKWLSYEVNDNGARSIYRFDGQQAEQISPNAVYHKDHQWAPDESAMVYVNRTASAQLEVIPFDADTYILIGGDGHEYRDPVWSPDGGWIAFRSNMDAERLNFELYRIRPDGTDLQRLTHTPTYSENWPAWSPNGNWIAFFVSNVIEGTHIQLAQADGSNSRRLTDLDTNELRKIAWSPIVDEPWQVGLWLLSGLLAWVGTAILWRA